jgi:titin
VIEGNYIGTDYTGLLPMSNHLNDAVSINLSPGNIIGGTVAGAGNVLDDGGQTGIFIYGDYNLGPYASAAGTLIAGNLIGLGADGETTAGLGNGYWGIVLDSAPDTTIGGTVAAARNVISNNIANDGIGILIANFEESNAAYGTVVQGNDIGTDITGTHAKGNNVGIEIDGQSSSLIGTDGLGGATVDAAEGNVISGNIGAGVLITGASNTFDGSPSYPGTGRNTVAGNFIGTNASGTSALGNGADGVELEGGASDNWIGETVAGTGNVISGNAGNGLEITGTGTNGNAVVGNFVGTDATGSFAIENTGGYNVYLLL